LQRVTIQAHGSAVVADVSLHWMAEFCFLAGEFSVSFEVWSGLIKVRRALFQSPKNIFPGSCSKTCISLQKECYFERIS
jgi:hypothetical protein